MASPPWLATMTAMPNELKIAKKVAKADSHTIIPLFNAIILRLIFTIAIKKVVLIVVSEVLI
jgi:hypothetical protein